jgi:hypothetical protein
MHQMVHEGRPDEYHAGFRHDPVFCLHLPVTFYRKHIGLGPGVEKADGTGVEITAPLMLARILGNLHIICAAQP